MEPIKPELTQSAIADKIRENLESYQDENGNYKFLNLIQSNPFTNDPIEITDDVLTPDVKETIASQEKTKVYCAFRKCFEDMFENIYGTDKLNAIRRENRLKIVYNGENLDDVSDDERFELCHKTIEDFSNDVELAAEFIVTYLIKRRSVISKIEINKFLLKWVKLLAEANPSAYAHLPITLTKKKCEKITDDVFSNPEIVEYTTKTAFNMGKNNEPILLDKSQTNEVAYWMKGRFHLKRLDLDGSLFFFDGKCQKTKAKEMIEREARKVIFQSTDSSVREVVSHCTAIADLIEFDDILAHSHLLCLKNGIYNVKTGEFTKTFSPDYLILNELPYSFVENPKFDKIDKVLEEIFTGNEPTIKQSFLDWLSIAFIPYAGLSFWYIVESMPGMGKSQLEVLVRTILGKDNRSNQNVHIIAKDATTRIDIANKFVNVDEEMSSSDIRYINTLKKWINQEPFTDRSIYNHNTNYRPRAMLMSLTNELFEIPKDVDAQAIYERTMIAELKQKFRFTDKEVKSVMEKAITDEQGNGFTTYLVKNATKLWNAQKVETRLTPDKIETIWNKYGNNIRKFFESNFVRIKGAKILKQEVFSAWEDYTILKNLKLGGKNTFYQKFEEIANVEPTHTRNEVGEFDYFYFGIRLMTDDEKEAYNQTKLKEFENQ